GRSPEAHKDTLMGSFNGSDVRGRPFAKDNAGRKPGSKNKSTMISAALLEGEQPELLRKAIELAKRGNVPMLRFLLSRLLPRHRLVCIALPPMVSADDALNGLNSILRAVAAGAISPAEAAAIGALIAPLIDGSGKTPSRESGLNLIDHLRSL